MKIDAWLSTERCESGLVLFQLCLDIQTGVAKYFSIIPIGESHFNRLKLVGLEVKR